MLSARSFILMLCVLLVGIPQTAAQTTLNNKQPLEVTADKELEWDRTNKTYIARGKARAVQGQNSLSGDVLKAYYGSQSNQAGLAATADAPESQASNASMGGQTKIKKIEAFGSVVIKSDGNIAVGDRGVYNLETGLAVLTGGNLKLITAQETITAREKITFNSLTNIMTADGDAKIVQGTDIMKSDKFIANFVNQGGQRVLKDADALGNVVITTANETLTGDRGQYVAASNMAYVYGNVRIIRGENILTGARGQVNLTTRKSKLFSEASPKAQAENNNGVQQTGEKKRVRAIFYPE